ncbi:dipeptidyl aminopeptidase [Stutzerimonas nosocomialis]|uniref:alpha/beta hydrolase family protein n=1 Tax=Stutzerimonas nosocomialis TaxID=1056496 RepID=UPI00110983BF|nr:alpha/beta fold hydrolase [Stutzerimonas nosocomialis]TLX58948.1 dipeptidyl aminopeptidase [Stutzerimonas nosocomialis]
MIRSLSTVRGASPDTEYATGLRRWGAPVLLALGLVLLGGCGDGEPDAPEQPAAGTEQPATPDSPDAAGLQHPSEHLSVTRFPGELADADREAWREEAPEIERIEIASSADDAAQPALYYDSGSEQDKPLLLVLHSWSTDYLQNIDIPLGQFAVANDWVFMHPDFRGQNDGRPESTASDLAIADMQDALDYALDNARVDRSRIYLLGYSGGALNAMHLASRNPDLFAGVSLWVPVYDLVSWYRWNDERGEKYAGEIAQACGGEPTSGTDAHEECVKRSAKAHIDDAAGKVRIRIAHGIGDQTVPPDQALHAFNDLADEPDRIPQEQIDQLMADRKVPEALEGRSIHAQEDHARFDEAGAPVLLHLKSGLAELILFDGEHDMLYRPGLEWLAEQER